MTKKYTAEEIEIIIDALKIIYGNDLETIELFIGPLEAIYIYSGDIPEWVPHWLPKMLDFILAMKEYDEDKDKGGGLCIMLFKTYYAALPEHLIEGLRLIKLEFEPKTFWEVLKRNMEKGVFLYNQIAEYLLWRASILLVH